MVSREVNVNRPEHSWIPFYRELAEKLVNDGWREKQGELVRVLQRLRSEGVPIHPIVDNLSDDIDPFTLFAIFSQALTFENTLKVINALRSEFAISASPPTEKPFIPYAMPLTIGYFAGYEDIEGEISIMWDIFEHALMVETFEDISRDESLPALITAGLNVHGVRISKLTSALYWVNPFCFLHSDTVNAVGGVDLGIRATDAESYIECLRRTGEMTDKSFPEINIAVFKKQNPDWEPPNVWVIRAGEGNRLADEFRGGNYVAFNFGFDDMDLSRVSSDAEVEQRIKAHRPNRTDNSIRQMSGFLTTMKIGDYVLMPDRDRDLVHYGTVASDPYFGHDGTHKNRRQIEWNDEPMMRERLGLRGRAYGATVNHVIGDFKQRFFAVKDGVVGETDSVRLQLPEDSWVSFNIELGQKLIEGEWWLPEKRQEFDDMIDEIRWADPSEVSDEYEHERWTPDPYSFYLSFNMRTVGALRLPAYRKAKDLLDIDVALPDEGHRAQGLGSHFRFDSLPDDQDIDALWDFYRYAVEFDPIDQDGMKEFNEKYERVIAINGWVGRWDNVLSYWLYWINPRKYVVLRRLRRRELGLAEELGLPENVGSGHEYLRTLNAAREFAESQGKSLLDVNRDTTTRETFGLSTEDVEVHEPYGIDDLIADGVFLERSEIERMLRILQTKKNLILQGPPGVGKTFIARKLAYVLMGEKGERTEKRITSVQFHQSYSYEDFVGGFRPHVEDRRMVFTRQDGPFMRVCEMARDDPDADYVVLIDEINRGNLSRVFGELLMLIEADKRRSEYGVTLQHRPDAKERFFVPENVYIIGTMNLADRSLTGMNVAMRRRFGFVDLEPQFNERVFTDWLSDETDMPPDMQARINTRMAALNSAIADDASLGFNYAVGHSFFCPPEAGPAGGWKEWYETVVEYEIRPLLREYWFDAPDTANGHADKLLESD